VSFPPARPNAGFGALPSTGPVISAQVAPGKPRHASPLPMIVSLVILLGGSWIAKNASPIWLVAGGYVLTPMGVMVSYAFGRVLDLRGRSDVWYTSKPIFLHIQLALVVVAFIPAYFLIHRLAMEIAGAFA
jgi:hypothetical protein